MTDDDPMNDRETVYDRCKEFIARHSISHAKDRAVKEQQLKVSFVAHGNMTSEQVNTALNALAEQGVIVRAGGWLTMDAEQDHWYQTVIEWCAEREDSPRELIGELNGRLR